MLVLICLKCHELGIVQVAMWVLNDLSQTTRAILLELGMQVVPGKLDAIIDRQEQGQGMNCLVAGNALLCCTPHGNNGCRSLVVDYLHAWLTLFSRDAGL